MYAKKTDPVTAVLVFGQNRTKAKKAPDARKPISTPSTADGLAFLFARAQLFLALPTLLQCNPGTHPHVVRAGIASVPQGQARGVLWRRKKELLAVRLGKLKLPAANP
jgi:hypothetical protein